MSFENCKKMRKRRPKIPFGIYYDYRNDIPFTKKEVSPLLIEYF